MRYLSCLKPIVNLRCSKFYQNTSISWKLLVQENGQRYLASSVGICESVDSKDKKIQQHKQDLQQRHESKLAGRIRNSQTHANLEVNNAALLSTSISVSEDDLAWKEVLDDSNYQKMINDELKNSTQLRTDLPSLYKRKLDQDLCIPFNSEKGKKIFMSSLGGKYGNIYHTLSLQFVTQYNSLFCGPSSLVMVLNALHVDPGREWKYPWRWYDDEMLNSCKPIQHTSSNGCSLDALACMAKSNHLTVEIVRASLEWQIEDFRRDVMRSCSSYDQPMIANFSRSMFNQTGTGHFSPIGGYDEVTDMILVMETARFKYPPFWVELEKMWEAMRSIAVNGKGISSGSPRGYLILKKPEDTPVVTVKLPWKNSQIKLENLSEHNLNNAYILKTFSKHWNSWLESKNTLNGNGKQLIGESFEILCQIADNVNERCCPQLTHTIDSGKLIDTASLLPNDVLLKETDVYHEINKKIKALNNQNDDIKYLTNLFLEVSNIIDFKREDFNENKVPQKNNFKMVGVAADHEQFNKNKASHQISSQNSKMADNSKMAGIAANSNDDALAGILSILVLFWPYHQIHGPELIGSAMKERLKNDLQAFPKEFSSTVTQQIQVVDKMVQHIGHEKLYV